MEQEKYNFYKNAESSPGETARAFAEQVKYYLNTGKTKLEACQQVLDNYIDAFNKHGIPVKKSMLEDQLVHLEDDVGICTYTVIMLGCHTEELFNQFVTDTEIIVNVIVDVQNEILNEDRSAYNLYLTVQMIT